MEGGRWRERRLEGVSFLRIAVLGKKVSWWDHAGCGCLRSPSPTLSTPVSLPLGKALGERIRNTDETAMI